MVTTKEKFVWGYPHLHRHASLQHMHVTQSNKVKPPTPPQKKGRQHTLRHTSSKPLVGLVLALKTVTFRLALLPILQNTEMYTCRDQVLVLVRVQLRSCVSLKDFSVSSHYQSSTTDLYRRGVPKVIAKLLPLGHTFLPRSETRELPEKSANHLNNQLGDSLMSFQQ